MKKKIYIPFLLMFLVASVFAQTQKLSQEERLEKFKSKIVEKQNPIYGEKSLVLRLDSTLNSHYNDWDSTWFTFQKTQYSYTSIGLIQEEISGDLYNGVWTPYWKTNYTYTANNVLTDIVSHWWDYNSMGWMNDYKEVYTHNSLGQNTEIVHQFWNDSLTVWENNSKEKYTYNSFGNWDSVYMFSWDEFANNWVLDMRAKVNYNSNQTMSNAIVEFWSGIIWVPVFKIEWAYDANNYLISETALEFNIQTLSYVPSYRSLYTNNASGHVLIEEEQYYDVNAWLPSHKIEYTLDANNYIQMEINYWFDSYSMVWGINEKIDYFYTNVTSVNDLISNLTVRTYPNPVSDFLIVKSEHDMANVRIFSINGQVVASFNPASKEATIDVSNFANGVYFVHVLSKDGNSVQKIIVQH